MIQRYQNGIAIDVKHIRRRDASGALVDAEAAYITEAGVKRQVWPVRKYLYKAGDECADVTGGWNIHYGAGYSGSSYGSLTKNTDNMHLWVASANYYVSAIPIKSINMTKYNYLTIEGIFKFQVSGEGSTVFAMAAFDSPQSNTHDSHPGHLLPATITHENGEIASGMFYVDLKNKTLVKMQFNTSQVTGNKYLYLIGQRGVLNLTFNKIYLE